MNACIECGLQASIYNLVNHALEKGSEMGLLIVNGTFCVCH
jgi:hypothetical protein